LDYGDQMFRNITRLEIELHGGCNRQCEWCINHYVPRDKNIDMEDEIFLSIIKSLKENNFEQKLTSKETKIITFNGYSEPLMHSDMLKKRLSHIRKEMPSVYLGINTNGDYLSKEILDGLSLDSLSIMDYDNKGKKYWLNKFKELGIIIISHSNVAIHGVLANISSIKCSLNWTTNVKLEDRGGFLPKELDNDIKINWNNNRTERSERCYEPITAPVINYNGKVMMCCEVRSDINEDLVIGDLHDNTLEEIFTSKKYIDLIDIFLNKSVSEYPSVCKTCHKYRDNPLRNHNRENKLKELNGTKYINRNNDIKKSIKR